LKLNMLPGNFEQSDIYKIFLLLVNNVYRRTNYFRDKTNHQ